jgi:hypothetical protein
MSDPINPYIAGNPVTGEAMFFGRESIFAFVRQALTGQHRDNVIVIYGQRRTGKTSALYQMHRHLDPRYLCIFVDLHGLALNGIDGFLWDLANTIVRALRREHQIDLPPLKRAEFKQDARASFENDFLNQVWAAIGDRRILLMLDEAIRLQEQIDAGKLEKSVFEYLRHLMQHFDQLNFLFALGSGLEGMEKEYAFLFSVGLYRKISFLTRDAATALITQPVKDYYKLEPATVDLIFSITSGHPYFTQLVCHGLFTQWLQHRRSTLRPEDVSAVLNEAVERGLAVLKQVWDDSLPGEQAIMAALSSVMGRRNHPISLAESDRVWAALGVIMPSDERAKAVRSLIARDVLSGDEKYMFTVELQRLWILKYKKLEWVKEELAATLRRWQVAPERIIREQQQRSRTTQTAWALSLTFFTALILILTLGLRTLNERYTQEVTYRQTLEAQIIHLTAAEVTGTAAARRPAITATAAARQWQQVMLTATAMATQCLWPLPSGEAVLTRVNGWRAQNDLPPVQLDGPLSMLAAERSVAYNAGAYLPSEVDGLIVQGCQLDDLWLHVLQKPAQRDLLLTPDFMRVGIGLTQGSQQTLALKFGPLSGSTPAPTSTPSVTPSRTPRPAPTRTPTPTPILNLGPLGFDWSIETQGRHPSNPDLWRAIIRLYPHGGDGNYHYYHDGLPVDGPQFEVVYRACRDKPGSFWVEDGAGYIVKQTYYLSAPYCPGTSQP